MSSSIPMQSPCVSIILPCYNVEMYLHKALDSALNQTLTNIEIIPVDDGSPDSCADIIKEYAKKDPRIKPVFKQNGGYGTAVNAGLNVAKGEYIAILEPDDYVAEDYYYVLYNEAKKDDLDVCGVNAYCEVRDFEPLKLIQTHWIENQDYMSFEGVNEYLSSGNVGITLKIYKQSFLKRKKISLKEDLKAYHDLPFVVEAMISAEKVRITKGVGYFYRKDNELSTTKKASGFFNILNAIDHVLNLADNFAIRKSRKSAILGCSINHLLHYAKLLEGSSDNDTYSKIESAIRDIVSKGYPLSIVEHHRFKFNKYQFVSDNVSFAKRRIITFDSCPSFDKSYFDEHKNLADMLSYLNFYSYFVITTNDLKQVEAMRDILGKILHSYPGLRLGCITDFIFYYFRRGLINYSRDWNTSWYNVFAWYMKDIDNNFLKKVYEPLSGVNASISRLQFVPKVAEYIDYSYAELSSNFRKCKVINEFAKDSEKRFLDFIKDKSIAVVGNAPNEIGKKLGKEIDSHDIVVRFNNFSTAPQFTEDYGKKTNIWAITPGIENLYFSSEFYNFDYIMAPDLGFELSQQRLDIIYNYLVLGGSFHFMNSIRCRQKFNICVPSVGLYLLYYIYEYINLVDKVSLYGFSPLSAKKDIMHYFNDDPAKTSNLKFHDWDKEAIILNNFRKLFESHSRSLGVK